MSEETSEIPSIPVANFQFTILYHHQAQAINAKGPWQETPVSKQSNEYMLNHEPTNRR